MVNLTQENNMFIVHIKVKYTQLQILDFLNKQGYTVKSWLWQYSDTSFPNGTTYHEKWTFTATMGDEPQGESNIYTKVFEKEVKELLKFE